MTLIDEDRVELLLDDTQTVEKVTGRDIRWMVLFKHKELLSEMALVKSSVDRIEYNGKSVQSQVSANSKAIMHIEHIENECPLSTREKQTTFVKEIMESYAAEIATVAAAKAVCSVPVARPIAGGLTRPELINVLVGAIVLLASVIGWIVTSGRLPLPGQ